MNNNSNIYDINEDLIRSASDNGSLPVKEAEERLEKYRTELSQLPENERHKATVLQTYIKNLSSYIFNYYIIHPEEYSARVKSTEQQVKEAIEDLKAEVEMNEYVEPIEEIKDGESATNV